MIILVKKIIVFSIIIESLQLLTFNPHPLYKLGTSWTSPFGLNVLRNYRRILWSPSFFRHKVLKNWWQISIKYLQKYTDEIRVLQEFWSEFWTSSQLCNYCMYFLWGVQNANDFLHQWICKSLQHFSKLWSAHQFHGYFDTSNLLEVTPS